MKVNELQVEIKRLKKIIEKQEKQLQEKTQQLKSTRSKLKTAKRAIAKIQKVKVKKVKKAKAKGVAAPVKTGRRTREQYLNQQKFYFITRFGLRLVEDDVYFSTEGSLTPAVKILRIMEAMKNMTVDDINTKIYLNGLKSAYYDSDGVRERIGIPGDEIYDDFVGYDPEDELAKQNIDGDADELQALEYAKLQEALQNIEANMAKEPYRATPLPQIQSRASHYKSYNDLMKLLDDFMKR